MSTGPFDLSNFGMPTQAQMPTSTTLVDGQLVPVVRGTPLAGPPITHEAKSEESSSGLFELSRLRRR